MIPLRFTYRKIFYGWHVQKPLSLLSFSQKRRGGCFPVNVIQDCFRFAWRHNSAHVRKCIIAVEAEAGLDDLYVAARTCLPLSTKQRLSFCMKKKGCALFKLWPDVFVIENSFSPYRNRIITRQSILLCFGTRSLLYCFFTVTSARVWTARLYRVRNPSRLKSITLELLPHTRG